MANPYELDPKLLLFTVPDKQVKALRAVGINKTELARALGATTGLLTRCENGAVLKPKYFNPLDTIRATLAMLASRGIEVEQSVEWMLTPLTAKEDSRPIDVLPEEPDLLLETADLAFPLVK